MNTRLVDSISTVDDVSLDLTKDIEYQRLVTEEIEHFSEIEVTENLTEGGVHAFKAWQYNYDFLSKTYFKTTLWDEVANHANRRENPRLLSLGCGHGGAELHVARKLRQPYELVALDLNPTVFDEADRRARLEGLNIKFKCVDLNFIDIEPSSFDVIYAVASLHHVLNLEHVFEAIHRGLKDNGVLAMVDIIGERQEPHWKENVEFAAKVIRKLPRRFRPVKPGLWKFWDWGFDPYSVLPRYVEPSKQIGMEGIRQDELESLLGGWFVGEKVFRYNAFMRLICTNPNLGQRLDPDRTDDRRYLESLIQLDYQQVQSGKLRPTELFGVFAKR